MTAELIGPKQASQLIWRVTKSLSIGDQFCVMSELEAAMKLRTTYKRVIFVRCRLRNKWEAMFIELQVKCVVGLELLCMIYINAIFFSKPDVRGPSFAILPFQVFVRKLHWI